jgi:dihydroorotate dehydrogenase
MTQKDLKKTTMQLCTGTVKTPGCNTEKSLTNFYEQPKGSGLYRKVCKTCVSKATKEKTDKLNQLNNLINTNGLEEESIQELTAKNLENKNRKELNTEYLIEKIRDSENRINELIEKLTEFENLAETHEELTIKYADLKQDNEEKAEEIKKYEKKLNKIKVVK